MITFPNAKINVGLHIKGKRSDGFHNIETVFYPIGLCDILEIIISEDGKFRFQSSGLPIPGAPEKNLCVTAFRLLAADHDLPAVKIFLHKAIPPGSGLGGGSSDAAHTIMLLNNIFGLSLSKNRMMDYARELGSDCPFFIENKAKYAFDKGDRFEEIDFSLKNLHIAVIKPPVNIRTKEAYSEVEINDDNRSLRQHINKPAELWTENTDNDFEVTIFRKHPEIRLIKNFLYEHGAFYASMSGSGSAVYGIFRDKPFVEEIWPDYFYWKGILI